MTPPKCAVIVHGKYCHCPNEPVHFDGTSWRCPKHSPPRCNGKAVKVNLHRTPEEWAAILASVKIRNKTKPRVKPRSVKKHPFKKVTTH